MKKTIKTIIYLGITAMLLLTFGCGISPETAREKLANLNIQFNRESFMQHARDGDIKAVRLFIQSGMDVNAKNKDGGTALIFATNRDQTEIVELLRQHGARE